MQKLEYQKLFLLQKNIFQNNMARHVYTFDELSNKLYEELSWRRKELTLLKSKIPSEKNPLQSVLLRSALPLLYAHWEGYVKLTMSYYLEYVSNKRLNHDQLKTSFIALSLQNKLGDLNNSNNIENRTKIIDFIFTDLSKQSNIPKKNIINTKSNLKYDVLKEILFILDLDDPHFDRYESLINDLVNERNYIAHGEHKLISYATYEAFLNDIISLMEFLKTSIENNAIQEKYKKPPLPLTSNTLATVTSNPILLAKKEKFNLKKMRARRSK